MMVIDLSYLRRLRIHFQWVMIPSPELDPDAVSYYLTVISILRMMIELGRINIITKVSLLSSHVALPREGHLDAVVHVMAHVGQRYYSRLVCDPLYPEDHSVFKKCD